MTHVVTRGVSAVAHTSMRPRGLPADDTCQPPSDPHADGTSMRPRGLPADDYTATDPATAAATTNFNEAAGTTRG